MKSRFFKRVFAGMGLVFLSATSSVATNSEEDAIKRVQQAKYSSLTGIWEIRLNEGIRPLEAGFKNFLPDLDYVLVDEKMRNAGRNTLIFRGQGDTKVVIKLRTFGFFTKISIRIGMTGNRSKSAQLFGYVYRSM